MNNSPLSEDLTSRKCLAAMLVLFVAYIYKETVFDPYFQPELARLTPPPVTHGATQQPGAAANPTSAVNAQTAAAPVGNQALNQVANPAVNPAEAPINQGFPSDEQIAAAGFITVTSDRAEIVFSKLGGRIVSLKLFGYAREIDELSVPLDLIDHTDGMPLPLGIYSGASSDAWVKYSASAEKIALTSPASLTLTGRLPDGREVNKILDFVPGGYLFDVTASVSAPAPDSSKLVLEWTKYMLPESSSMLDSYQIAGYIWFDGTKASREDFGKLTADEQPLGDVRWVTLADKYFMATLLNREGSFQGKLTHDKTLHSARANGDPTSIHLSIFAGPKDYEILSNLGFEMQRNLNLGYTAIIAAPLLWLIHLFYGLLGNYGLAIVVLTIIVKLATYPLAASSYKQMKGMSDLAPELKRIRETVTDKQEQQLRTMALYKEKGVNPVGGCLPILLQMPIFIGLYTALSLSIELRHAPFMFWIKDLSAPEKLYIAGFPIPLMVVLFTASMIIQQVMTPSNMEPAQRRMMLAMPLVFGFMFANMPAGLTLYWLTNNIISIGQQKGFKVEGVKHALMLTMGVSIAVFIFVYILVASSGTIS